MTPKFMNPKEHIKQLHRAVEIVRRDLSDRIERERVRLDLYELQLHSGIGMEHEQTATDTTKEELGQPRVPDRFVDEMVKGLDDALSTLADVTAGEGKYPHWINAKPGNVIFRLALWDKPQPFRLHMVMEPSRYSAIVALFRHLEGSGLSGDRVRRCPFPDCGNVFILGSHARTDRMRYCSTRCSGLAATHAYRNRNKARQLAAEGKSVAAIAKETNVDLETIKKWVKAKGAYRERPPKRNVTKHKGSSKK